MFVDNLLNYNFENIKVILQSINVGLIEVDKEGKIIDFNENVKNILGIKCAKTKEKIIETIIEKLHIVENAYSRKTIEKKELFINDKILEFKSIALKNKDEIIGNIFLIKDKTQYNLKRHENNRAVYTFENIISKSEIMDKTKELAKKVAHTTSNVLLIGESGTGKELFAHAIHKASERSYGNFVKVNCAAIPKELLESELFGYEKGSFTGANKNGKIGKFELADGGTIFLDEIGDMPLSMQVKLLRVIQEKEVERIGADYTKSVDIRIIAATNRNLKRMVQKGEFRQDLYYRLNVVTIKIPALRERKEDIEILIYYLIKKISNKLNKNINGISKEAVEYMKNYTWKGNIRELENVIERAINIVDYGEKIDVEHLCREITGKTIIKNIKKLDEVINKAEKEAIINALNACKGNKSKVAKLLQISRTTLYEKMNKHNILG